jgi:hypothetical protein
MSDFRIRIGRRLFLFLALMAVLSLVPSALANVRVEGGGEVPFYARLAANEFFHTDEWAVIVFYRPPECMPDDFNLLTFFDIPGAFACGPATTDGFNIWENGPGLDLAPLQVKLHGLGAVPVWFVSWSELQAAVADGVLTVPELESLPSLRTGTAQRYTETLHPGGGAQVPRVTFVAHGLLESGEEFQAQGTAGPTQVQVNIMFK